MLVHHRIPSMKYYKQSTVGKTMAAVHFTSRIFGAIFPCTSNIVYARFEVYRTFLCMSVRTLRIMGKSTSRHLFPYGGIQL